MSETWRSYVISVSVDEDAITVGQYNALAEHIADQTHNFFGPVWTSW